MTAQLLANKAICIWFNDIFRKKNNNWRNETHYSETLVYTIVSFFYEIALVQLVYASLILLMHTSTASFSIHQHMLCAALHAAAARVWIHALWAYERKRSELCRHLMLH